MAIVLPPDVTLTESKEGLVLMDQRNGRNWSLNPTAAATLRLLLDGYSPEAAAARLTREFPAMAERAGADVLALLGALRDAGLVENR